jgi:hypothetical protein
VLGTLPPYALQAPVFRLTGLASLAGRRPLGGDREVAVAAFMAAHLVAGTLPAAGLDSELRAGRARMARAWLAAVALPAPTRAPFARVIEATGRADTAAVRPALRAMIDAAARYLDPRARRELDTLAGEIGE